VSLLRRVSALEVQLQQETTRKNEVAMDLCGLRNQHMESDHGKEAGRAFNVRSTDVFIVTYPKCGTTWVTQICHMLRGGDMNFGEITEVVPWDVMASQCGQDLDAEQVNEPRLFKSHEAHHLVAKGGKYVYVARDPLDAFVSFFKFMPGYMGLQGDDITMTQFANAIFAGAAGTDSEGVSHSGRIWDHYMGWYEARNDPNVLWVFFEDLKQDLEGQVKRIADFMQIGEGMEADRLVAEAVQKASFKFMSSPENKSHFDDHFVFDNTKVAMGLGDQSIAVSKVRLGKTGTKSTIDADILKRLQDKWAQVIEAKTGCADYAAFRKKINAVPVKREAPVVVEAEEEGVRGSSTHVDLKDLKDSGSGDLTAEEFAALRAKTKTAAECAKNMTPEQQAEYGCKTGVAASAVREDSDDSDDEGADFQMGAEGQGALLADY